MGTVSTFVSWSGTESTVTNVTFVDPTGAHETIGKICTGGVLVTVMSSKGTFVDGNSASVTVTDVTIRADAIVTG